jgi:hypothetical protein
MIGWTSGTHNLKNVCLFVRNAREKTLLLEVADFTNWNWDTRGRACSRLLCKWQVMNRRAAHSAGYLEWLRSGLFAKKDRWCSMESVKTS